MEDNCQLFEVDLDSRSIVPPEAAGVIAVERDRGMRDIRICLPRWYHGIDLGEFDFRVNWLNGEIQNGSDLLDAKDVGDVNVELIWRPSAPALQASGTVQWSLCGMVHAPDNLTVEREFHTVPTSFEVPDTLEDGDWAELEQRLDWVWKVVADCESATADALEAADYVYRVAANAIRENQTALRLSPTEPRIRGDGMLWMQTDEAAAEITALKRWDADERGAGLLPSNALLPSNTLLPKDKGAWKEFKLAASVLAAGGEE